MSLIGRFLLGCMACWLCSSLGTYAQLIDTAEDPYVTPNDTINQRMQGGTGFVVEVMNPEMRTTSGVRLQHGFDTYYLHVLEAKDVLIEGAKLNNRGERTFLAVISKEKKPVLDSSALKSRALFLKGIILGEDAGGKVVEYQRRAQKFRKDADSLKLVIEKTFMPERELITYQQQLGRMAEEAEVTARAYEKLQGTGYNGMALSRFMLARYLNRSVQYSIASHPYNLPELPPNAEKLRKAKEKAEKKAAKGKKAKRKKRWWQLWR